jgi:hypothetical protein
LRIHETVVKHALIATVVVAVVIGVLSNPDLNEKLTIAISSFVPIAWNSLHSKNTEVQRLFEALDISGRGSASIDCCGASKTGQIL